jgi:hypothetical protein
MTMGLIRNATKIDLSNSNLNRIPSELFNYNNVQKLILRNNIIKVIPREISSLKRLRMLDLSNNMIEYPFAKLFTLDKLEILILNNNRIKSIPSQVSQLIKLKKFSLSGNNIKVFPREIKKLSNLEYLNISNNQFYEFPSEILALKHLKTLRISNLNLTTFPAELILKRLPNLKYLYCYSAHIKRIKTNETNKDYLFLASYKGNCFQKLKGLVELSSTLSTQVPSPDAPSSSIDLRNKKQDGLSKKGKSRNEKLTKIARPLSGDNRNIIFICYSHKDERWRKKVETVIKTMTLDGFEVRVWSDKKIRTGFRWQDSIFDILSKTRFAILLVSNDFLASEFIREKELPRILKKAESDELTIMSIILSYCRYSDNPDLSQYQSLNPPDLPLASLPKYRQDFFLLQLTRDIEKYLD